jgi:uncharacterized protein YjeT (DUF2065 family)
MTAELQPAILAIVLLVLGVSYVFQWQTWSNLLRSILADPQRFFLGAIVEVALGLWLALSYDRWDSTWPIFTTAIGWLMALEGSLFLLAPRLFNGFSRLSDRSMSLYLRLGGVLLVVLGALLARFAFGA